MTDTTEANAAQSAKKLGRPRKADPQRASSLAETDPVALARVDPGGGARLGAGSCAVGA